MMPTTLSTAHWIGQPMVPSDYDDIASLVKLAREARNRIVDFDWAFTRDDLEGLRLAVKEWGSGFTGRYKCFDARVLAAINDSLGEKNSTLALKEPKNGRKTDCEVTCAADGDRFRLRGHAPFDIVFGYGSAGVGQDPTRMKTLGPTVQKTLADAVGMLGWDLHRLQDERLRPVRNVLYGMAPDYRVQYAAPAAGPVVDVKVHFHGPFSAVDDGECRCLFNDEMAKCTGIYLWTINVGGEERIWYVGQTRRSFGQRMGEHIASFLSGKYHTYDVAALSRGEHRLAAAAVNPDWPQTLPSFLREYKTLAPSIIDLIRGLRFHLAQPARDAVDPEVSDAHIYNRVESAVGRHYKKHVDDRLLRFLIPGLKLPSAIPGDTRLRLLLSSDVPLAGLPRCLMDPPETAKRPQP